MHPYVLNAYGILFMFSQFCEYTNVNVYVSMSYTGLPRRNTVFVYLWLRHRNAFKNTYSTRTVDIQL